MSSVHGQLARTRAPRVHITYEVETDGAQVVRELPFVVGVMGDFTGDPTKPLDKLANRKFIEINKDNFDRIMEKLAPGLTFRVENTLENNGTEIGVNLSFKNMDDFRPAQVVQKIPALKQLLDTRNKLRDLLSKADKSDELYDILEQTLKNHGDLSALAAQLGVTPTAAKKE
jgi:type VI secretion system protein ImpB